jgi:tetratricopeptide (TPR) repeat protein
MNLPNWMPIVENLKKAIALKDRTTTNLSVTQLLEMGAPLGENWRAFAELMRMNGEFTLAHRAMDAFVASTGNHPQAQYAKVVLHSQSGQMQQAFDLLSSLPADVPDPAGHQYVLGNAAMTLGKIAEARAYLSEAVKLKPGWGPAWLTLASTVNFNEDSLQQQLIADKNAAKKYAPAELARFYYALGKMYMDKGNSDKAFASYNVGAKLLRQDVPYSKDGNETNAQNAMSGFDTAFINKLNEQKSQDTSRPIFVTGLPRSGTTLVEQILASHSQVANGAELNIAQKLAVMVGGNSGEALKTFIDNGSSIDDIAALYLHLLSERFGTQGRIIDKSIDMSRFLGLIAAALPDAPLIWMRRDPLDSAWSCFRTFFIHGVGWSYDLNDIAHHFMLEDQLLCYWQKVLGKRLLVVPYKELVSAPEEWTRKLLDHCGLAEEAGVFSPHTTKRVVMTASALQVRKPINLDGLNVAQPYKKHLQPFVKAYSPHLVPES